MLRLGATEKSITELVAIGEHVVGASLGATSMQLGDDLVIVEGVQGDSLEADIEAWTREHLGHEGVPEYWAWFRGQDRFREAHWSTHRLVLGAGEFDAKAKGLIALAVASFKGSAVWVKYFTTYCRVSLGVTDEEIQEAVMAAMHSVSFNTVAHGMMLQARYTDMRAEDFHD